jgi:hypothetical protein
MLTYLKGILCSKKDIENKMNDKKSLKIEDGETEAGKSVSALKGNGVGAMSSSDSVSLIKDLTDASDELTAVGNISIKNASMHEKSEATEERPEVMTEGSPLASVVEAQKRIILEMPSPAGGCCNLI